MVSDLKPILTAVKTRMDAATSPAWEGEAPQSQGTPFIVWRMADALEDIALGTYLDEENGLDLELNVQCWGDTATQAVDVDAEVSAALKGTTIAPTGWTALRRPKRVFSQLLVDPNTRQHYMVSRWSCRFSKS